MFRGVAPLVGRGSAVWILNHLPLPHLFPPDGTTFYIQSKGCMCRMLCGVFFPNKSMVFQI